ncbi:Hint domain-containing protein [Paracoccus aminovorans]|uniref:Hint domain-containing protein n=1 Tax=Paracoccus aminovorans TaxID=34004 RepID=A0A1I3EAE6_9RHOB|nr:Hint domain-containing protein [Paracoccus aminovorans]CQR84543.1 hemolysin-type calcium-binding protein [Paracoccus aminovorans]SFH95671.1 Hint domain-containing protein [Paracoccus aminovorans]
MADFTINANGFGSFYENVGNNGTDDTVTVNIGSGFSGTITVDSQPGDNEQDDTIVNLPDGWRLQVVNLSEDDSENPSFKDWSYEVLNADGQSVGTLSIRSNNIQGAPCFCAGTMIETPEGPVAVETLMPGDLVVTRDHGPQALRWIGGTRLSTHHLLRAPHLRPIRIRAGALGAGVPATDLLVSPQHRVLVRSTIAQRMFDAPEVLVAAKQLLMLDGIDIAADLDRVDYFHLLFDRHEVVISNGAETESLYAGPEALHSLGRVEMEEIFALAPALRDPGFRPQEARPLPSGRKARKLAMRHIQHQRPLVMANMH